TTVTVTLAAGSEVVCAVAQYSGVGALGLTNTNSGTGTAPIVSVTTQDNNNWVVAGFAHEGATGTLSAQTGTLRQVKVTSGSSVKGALTDNTSATPASVTNAVTATQTGTNWAAAALELRTKSTDTIIFSRNATVHSVDFNGATFSANWTTTPTGGPTVSTPVDDGAGNIYIGGSDGKVHRLLSCLMLFSLSWAVQRGFFGEAPDVGEDRLRQTSRVGRPVARVVAAPSDEDDASAPADEDGVAIDPADIDSGQRAAKRGPA